MAADVSNYYWRDYIFDNNTPIVLLSNEIVTINNYLLC